MKLRIHGNSLRLRLKQAEVAALAAGSSIEEHCGLPGSPLVYRLVPAEGPLDAYAAPGLIEVRLPATAVGAWAATDQVGFSGQAGAVTLLIEKDWRCLDPADPAENEDTFEHPNPADCQGPPSA